MVTLLHWQNYVELSINVLYKNVNKTFYCRTTVGYGRIFTEVSKIESNNETCIQNFPTFKAKKIINRFEMDRIISGLDKLNFRHEIIYWYERLLKESVCNKDEIYESLNSLCHCYFDIFEYEKCLEYGTKALACIKAFESIKSYRVCT